MLLPRFLLRQRFGVTSQWLRYSTQTRTPVKVLGIETSCDDTGCAVVNSNREILGEAAHSQLQFHLRNGAIQTAFTHEFHRQHIERVCNEALDKASLRMEDIDAIAVTNRPGIEVSLKVGIRYAKHLARKYQKPIIPVNHMEAHALAARIENTFDYPFLCLLASGGHCQLIIVRNVNEFQLLGETMDKAPGVVFDRIARAINLHALPEYRTVSGGQAIEMAAYKATNADRFPFTTPLQHERTCDFSFGSFISSATDKAETLRHHSKTTETNGMIPYHEDFCAGVLKAMTNHLLQRTQRAIHYCERTILFGYGDTQREKNFVFSGGVACNQFIFKALSELSKEFGYNCYKPSNRLCNDNGVMIAWAGMELWLQDPEKYRRMDIDSVLPSINHGFNTDHVALLRKKHLKYDWVKVPCMQKDVISLDDT